jgi:hypothetical protein
MVSKSRLGLAVIIRLVLDLRRSTYSVTRLARRSSIQKRITQKTCELRLPSCRVEQLSALPSRGLTHQTLADCGHCGPHRCRLDFGVMYVTNDHA